jgi:hypothetical protein
MASTVEMDSPIVDKEAIHDTIVRQLKRILQITIEVWGSESTELVACWLTGLMDAVVGEYSWNDAVQIDVPDVLEMQQPGVLRATKSVRSWQDAIQSLVLDEVEPWDWYTCADCGYGDSHRDDCRVHKIVHEMDTDHVVQVYAELDNGKRQRLNPQQGVSDQMQQINPF